MQERLNELAGRRDRVNVSNPGNRAEPADLAVRPGHTSQIGEAGKIGREEELRRPVGACVFRLADISTAVDQPPGQFVKEPDIVGS